MYIMKLKVVPQYDKLLFQQGGPLEIPHPVIKSIHLRQTMKDVGSSGLALQGNNSNCQV